jgi:hypothetical protein
MSALTPHRRFIATTVCLTLLLALGIDRLLPEQATRESTLQYFVPWLTFWLVACAGILWLWWKQELTAEFWRTPELALGGFAIPLVVLVIAVVLPPAFSDDIYRCVFEGYVVAAGKNPYLLAPRSQELYPIASRMPDVWRQINNGDLAAIYPPLQQLYHGLLATMGLGVNGFRGAGIVIAVLGCLLTGLWLRSEGLPMGRLIVFWALPVFFFEVGNTGHGDVWMVAGSALVFLALSPGWESRPAPWRVGSAALGMAVCVLTKLAPIVLLPHLVMQFRTARERVALVLAVLLLCGAAYAPFAGAGRALFGSLEVYNKVWEHNGFAHPLLVRVYTALDPEGTSWGAVLRGTGLERSALETTAFEPIHPNQFGARATEALLFGVLWIVMLVRKRDRFDVQWLVLVGGGLLLAPVVHPWYLLALLPAALRGGTAGAMALWWIVAAPFTYAMLPAWWKSGAWEQPAWTWWLQYGGMAVVALVMSIQPLRERLYRAVRWAGNS